MKLWERHRTALLIAAAAAAAGSLLAADLVYLVTSRFSSHRWSLPTRIYSDVESISPGLQVGPEPIEAKLRRLLYQRVSRAPDRAGQFRLEKGKLEVWARSFDELGRHVSGFPVVIGFSRGAVSSLATPDGQRVASLTLEPEIIGSVYDKKLVDRSLVSLSDVPQALVDAVLAREDRDFFQHGGISIRRILGALWADVRHGGASQGGSTLTQQLVKNLYLSPERTLRRKAIEATMAMVLDACYSKEDILETYLNEIYLGQRGAVSITGVAEASRFYFGKRVEDLDLAESATLAGMIASPGRYNPFRYPDRCRARRDGVLKILRDTGRITAERYARAVAEPLVPESAAPPHVAAPHFVDFVEQQLAEAYGPRLGSEGLRVYTTLDVDLQTAAQQAITSGLASLEKNYPRLRRASRSGPLQGALIVLDPATGAVRALVGGRDYSASQFNRVTQAHRQPGSLFKPFVYLAAFARRDLQPPITPATMLIDSPITLVWGQGTPDEQWTPHNDDNEFRGPVSVRRALELSINVPTVRVAVQAGLDSVVAAARAAGITSRLQGYPSLALGAFEITPMEMAAAYSVFADEGVRVEPNAIVGVETTDGTVLARTETPLERVLPPDAVYMVDSLMQGVVNRGTGAGIRARGIQGVLAGKTGTTNDERDAWFIGFSPRILGTVWVGYDDNTAVRLSGSQAAVPIFADFIRRVPGNLLSEPFPKPSDVVTAQIDPETGMLVTPSCPKTMSEVFLEGTAPTQYCTLHGASPAPAASPDFVPPPGTPPATGHP